MWVEYILQSDICDGLIDLGDDILVVIFPFHGDHISQVALLQSTSFIFTLTSSIKRQNSNQSDTGKDS
jgi:hypothetical protein